MFDLCNLGVLSACHKCGIFGWNFVLKFLKILQLFSLLLLLYIFPLFSILPCFGLSNFLCLLHSLLNTVSFCYLFQMSLELLLLFMSLQHLLMLLFKHFSISLGDIWRQRGKHDSTGKSWILHYWSRYYHSFFE